MFYLRTFANDGTETNTSLGEYYELIDRFINYERFQQLFEAYAGRKHVADLDPTSDDLTKNCYGFISCKHGVFAVHKGENYIMTEGGKTFDSLYGK